MWRVLLACLVVPAGGAWSGSLLKKSAVSWSAPAKPALVLRRSLRCPKCAEAAASPEPEPKAGPLARITAALPPKAELQKLLPLGLMFFCILFSYTILRDTKDVLVVTAPGSSAEVIPFLKTYVNLPGATAFVLAYSALSNRLGGEALFYAVLAPFLAFFGAFAWIIYPLRDFFHPNAFADMLTAALPLGFAAPIGVLRNWTYSLFYLLANMWGSVVVSLMFWGFANEITTVAEAKKYYPLFGMGANVALVFSGQFVRYVSQLKGRLAPGVDSWGVALKLLMSAVCLSGGVIAACYRYLTVEVVNKRDAGSEGAAAETKPKKKKKPSLSLGESASYLASSPYIRNLGILVIAYGMSINLVEVTWKAKLKEQFPDPSAYAAFMGQFSSATGVTTLLMMLFGRFVLRKFGWGTAAQITPLVLLITGAAFFALTLAGSSLAPVVAMLGTTPLMLAVLVGAAQNIVSKAAKYSLFDPCKEMAYIPLDAEQKTKGKAAIDVIGAPLGKSGGSLIQQLLIFRLGSLAASTPYLAAILTAIIGAWILAARGLSKQFEAKMADMPEDA